MLQFADMPVVQVWPHSAWQPARVEQAAAVELTTHSLQGACKWHLYGQYMAVFGS